MIFSIVIPVFNIEDYLFNCIESILEQNFEMYEVVLVNDGSTDRSGEICDYFSDLYDKVKVIHKKNGELSDARNQGVAISKGKYLIFLDGDDYCEQNFLSNLSNFINSNNDPDIILCNGFFQFEDGKTQLIYKPFNLNPDRINNLNGEKVLEYLFKDKKYSNWSWSACFNIYKTDYWKINNFNFKVGTTCEDAELIPKTILLSSRCGLFDGSYYCYRVDRSGSIMDVVSEKRVYDMINITEGWLKYSSNYSHNKKLTSAIQSKYSNEVFRYIKYLWHFDKESRDKIIYHFNKVVCSKHVDKPNYMIYNQLIKFIGYENVSKIMEIESKLLFHIKNKVIPRINSNYK